MKRAMRSKKPIADNITESWLCVDCNVDTAPGFLTGPAMRAQFARGIGEVSNRAGPDTEVYGVLDRVWKKAGMQAWNGCLCIGCLEKRLGRKLTRRDFDPAASLNRLPGSQRLQARRGHRGPAEIVFYISRSEVEADSAQK